jgi:hypothetical protein
MILKVSDLKKDDKFKDIDEVILTRKLKAIESAIRAYTNNNFQNEKIRFEASSSEGVLNNTIIYLNVDDTVQISKSINDGLFTIKEITSKTVLDRDIYDSRFNLVTKIEYPLDIQEGVYAILEWELAPTSGIDGSSSGKDLSGVASESISRHSVSYDSKYNQATSDPNFMGGGYPSYLTTFLEPYKRMKY